MLEIETLNPNMPDEIVMDILSRLPVKSLLQFRCVSKRWRSLIADTHFIGAHLNRSLLSSKNHKVLLPIFPLQSVDFNASSNIVNESTELDCPFVNPNTLIKLLGSWNGLVCLLVDNRDMFIYNPSTRHSNALPPPEQLCSASNGIDFVYGFGCGLTSDDFRVVRLPRFARHSSIAKFEVFVLKNSSWRSKDLVRSFNFVDEVGTFFNGALHWLARRSKGPDQVGVIASINLSEEVFREISLPPRTWNLPYYSLGVLEKRLSVLCDNTNYTHVHVWVMKEYGVKTSWTKFITVPRDMGIGYIAYMVPLCFLNDSEVLLEIDLRKFVAFDTKKATFRNMMICGDRSWAGDATVYVESLVSPNGV